MPLVLDGPKVVGLYRELGDSGIFWMIWIV